MKITCYIFFFFCLNGCTSNKQPVAFEKRIQIDGFGNFDFTYAYTKEMTKYAGLNIIENGFDSICIRIWNTIPINIDQQMIEIRIKNNPKLWTANYYHFALDTANIALKYIKGSSKEIPDEGQYYYNLDTVKTMYKIIKKEKLNTPNYPNLA